MTGKQDAASDKEKNVDSTGGSCCTNEEKPLNENPKLRKRNVGPKNVIKMKSTKEWEEYLAKSATKPVCINIFLEFI